MEGTRKQKAFYATLAAINLVILVAFVVKVPFNSADIVSLITLESALAGAFFGANFGEHWSKARAVQNGKNGVIQ